MNLTLLNYVNPLPHQIQKSSFDILNHASPSCTAKFEEQDVAIPRISDLKRDLPDLKYTGSEFLQMELLLLDFYDWNVSFPTPAHFTEYYLEFALDNTDLLQGKRLPPVAHIKPHLAKYTTYFLEISMQGLY